MHAGVRAATQERWEDAERFFQIVLQQEPNSASAYSNLGNVHLSEGLAELAARDFTRAIDLAPDVRTRLPSLHWLSFLAYRIWCELLQS